MKKLLITFLFLISLTPTAFTQNIKDYNSFESMLKDLLTHSVKEVKPSEVKLTEQTIILDAREKNEYDVSHIKGAIWIGYNDFKLKRIKKINKDANIMVYCSVGYRSEKVAEKLVKAGYTDVSNLYGGIFEWVNIDKPVINKEGSTKKVHTFNKEWSKWLLKGTKVY